MNSLNAPSQALDLMRRSKTAILGTIDENGFPNMKALLNLNPSETGTVWFSTNTSSLRVGQIRRDNRTCVYFLDQDTFEGLMLIGQAVVLQDPESRKLVWREGFEQYYPGGIDDPDYSVIRFTAVSGNYYHGLKNVSFNF